MLTTKRSQFFAAQVIIFIYASTWIMPSYLRDIGTWDDEQDIQDEQVMPLPAPVPGVGIKINPEQAEVSEGKTQQFSASVIGSENQNVNWLLLPDSPKNFPGTISSDGLYQAPSGSRAVKSVRVLAWPKADPTQFAIAIITIDGSRP